MSFKKFMNNLLDLVKPFFSYVGGFLNNFWQKFKSILPYSSKKLQCQTLYDNFIMPQVPLIDLNLKSSDQPVKVGFTVTTSFRDDKQHDLLRACIKKDIFSAGVQFSQEDLRKFASEYDAKWSRPGALQVKSKSDQVDLMLADSELSSRRSLTR